MKLEASLAGEPVPVTVVESERDRVALLEWIAAPRLAVGLDVETTGLDIFGGDTLRTVQFGDEREAWVVPVSTAPDRATISEAIRRCRGALVLHNATFDLLALDHAGIAPLDITLPRADDTRLLAHLIDPRGKHEGGVGHGLKELGVHYLGDGAADQETALKARFRELGFRVANGWAGIDIYDPVYLRYAALDPVLTARLLPVLGSKVAVSNPELYEFERAVSAVCARMQAKGLLVDTGYATALGYELEKEESDGEREAALLGVSSVNSPKQVGEVLTAVGANLVETTSSGAPKVDKAVLEALVDNEPDSPAGMVAAAVLKAKRAGKWRTAYVSGVLDRLDPSDRVHPWIHSLQARTARMSISDPPLQQLPSGDHRIRRMFVPEPGKALVAVDYAQVEMRILAALSQDKRMIDAILSGEDLHSTAAKLMFGDDFTDKQRKLAKVAGFAKVYGGGAAVIARQTGVSFDVAQNSTARYDRAFPGIRRYGNDLQAGAHEVGRYEVVTTTGRVLPLDRERMYAATNYIVQSTARDVMAQALVNLDEAGLGDYLLLPIHDEVLAEVPSHEAADIAKEIASVMEMDFFGIPLVTDSEVAPGSWGSLYGADS